MFTELDALNEMLEGVGIAPVASLDSQHPVFKQARTQLAKVSRRVQSTGLWFNRSRVTLKPTLNGDIMLPATAVYARPDDDQQYVERDGRIFDLNNRTYKIDRELTVTLIEVLPYQSLPVTAMDYIAARAKYEFFVARGGQDPKLSEYRNQANLARVEFNKENLRNLQSTQPSLMSARIKRR